MKIRGIFQTEKKFQPQKNEFKSDFIKIYCRIRPIDSEIIKYKIVGDDQIHINEKQFKFTKIFDHQSDQYHIAENVISPIIQDLYDQEKNGLVFTYGVTNAGKSYTVLGNEQKPGLIKNAFQKLLEIKQQFENQLLQSKLENFDIFESQLINKPGLEQCQIFFESFEIYNEDIFDLLNRNQQKLQIRYINKQNKVGNLERIELQSMQDFDDVIRIVSDNRSTQKTELNLHSSRSHTIYNIILKMDYKTLNKQHTKELTLCIVDLAGSERIKRTDNKGALLLQQCNINQSLLTLDRCIRSMIQKKRNPTVHIPFRDSKLTQVFQDYFTENNNLRMILNINPQISDQVETLKALTYAALTKQIVPIQANYQIKEDLKSDWENSKNLHTQLNALQLQGKKQDTVIEQLIRSNQDDLIKQLEQKAILFLQCQESKCMLETSKVMQELRDQCLQEGQQILEQHNFLIYDLLEEKTDHENTIIEYLKNIIQKKDQEILELQKANIQKISVQCSPIKIITQNATLYQNSQILSKSPSKSIVNKSPQIILSYSQKKEQINSCEKYQKELFRIEEKENLKKEIMLKEKKNERKEIKQKEIRQNQKKNITPTIYNSYKKKLRTKEK